MTVVVAVPVCLVLALRGELSRLEHTRLDLKPGWLLASASLVLLMYLAHAMLWRLTLRDLGVALRPRASLAIWFPSVLARYIPSSALMAIVRVDLAKRSGAPKRQTVASLVYEVALSMVGAIAVAAYFVLTLPELDGLPVRFAVLAVPIAALGAVHPRVFAPLTALMLQRFRRESLPRVLPFSQVLLLSVGYGLSCLVAGAGLLALVEALYGVQADVAPAAVGAFAIGYGMSALAVVLPAGLGAREAAIVAALSPVMSAPKALTVAVVLRVLSIAVEVGATVVAVAMTHQPLREFVGTVRGPSGTPASERTDPNKGSPYVESPRSQSVPQTGARNR